MKPSHLITLATAVAGAAVACAICITHGQPTKPAASPATTTSAHKNLVRPRATEISAIANHQSHDQRATGDNLTTLDTPAQPPRITRATSQRPARLLTEKQWLARAAKVETEANHELNRLTGLLDLNPNQQARIFEMVAKNSPSWVPGMTVHHETGVSNSNTPTTTPTSSEANDIMAYLNADQQQTLVQEEMDRQAWWEEILPQLLPPSLDHSSDIATQPAETTPQPAPDTKVYDGSDVLLEE